MGTLAGVVLDPSGARVVHASVFVSGIGVNRNVESDLAGRFTVNNLPPGVYDVSIAVTGFRPWERRVTVARGVALTLKVKLEIAVSSEVVEVTPDARPSTSSADNRSALVLGDRELADLSGDNATLQQQLLALAGGNPGQLPAVYVDGFSGGRFPPKSSIQQVRINRNPFTSEFAGFGLNRIEIATRPGSAQLHGAFQAQGNDSPWNSSNPYAGVQPPYYAYFLDGHLSGHLGRKTSFFAGGTYHDQQNNAAVDAIDPATLGPLAEAVPTPELTRNESLRLDRQIAAKNTLNARYENNGDTLRNGGVGQLVLPSEAYQSTTGTQTLQIGDTAIVSPKLVMETRFQYMRTRLNEHAVNSAASLIVEGSFNAGGGSVGVLNDNQDRFEFQEHLSLDRGRHYLRTGGSYVWLRDANTSTANYNGTFTFPSLAAYRANAPTQFSLTAGQPSAVLSTGELGLYAEDEWKAAKSLTVNCGLRFESQTAIPDHADWAPRLGFAWAVGQRVKKAPLAVFRGGYGLFYDRFAPSNLLTAVRQNGVSQQTFVVDDPAFYPAVPSPATLETGANAVAPTTYSVSPRLRAEYNQYVQASVEHTFGRFGNVSATYLNERGVHLYLSRNVNAPLPGTYVFGNPASGAYPLGTSQAVYQFASDGISKSQALYVNANLHPSKRFNVWAAYNLQQDNADTSGASSFPSNQYNLAQDFGRASFQAMQGIFSGANLTLPWQCGLAAFLQAGSGMPFNITTGTDLNGDTVYNDRPAFATDLTRPSVVRTAFGNFDTQPLPSQKIVPFDYGTAPADFALQLSATKTVAFGPRAPAKPSPDGKTDAKGDAPFSLELRVEARNVFNHVNPGIPVGVLNSPYFGQSISLNSYVQYGSSANRSILLSSNFSF